MWEFAIKQPAAFLLFAMIFMAAGGRLTFLCWNRWVRHRNIVKQGWPPENVDADGDVVEPKGTAQALSELEARVARIETELRVWTSDIAQRINGLQVQVTAFANLSEQLTRNQLHPRIHLDSGVLGAGAAGQNPPQVPFPTGAGGGVSRPMNMPQIQDMLAGQIPITGRRLTDEERDALVAASIAQTPEGHPVAEGDRVDDARIRAAIAQRSAEAQDSSVEAEARLRAALAGMPRPPEPQPRMSPAERALMQQALQAPADFLERRQEGSSVPNVPADPVARYLGVQRAETVPPDIAGDQGSVEAERLQQVIAQMFEPSGQGDGTGGVAQNWRPTDAEAAEGVRQGITELLQLVENGTIDENSARTAILEVARNPTLRRHLPVEVIEWVQQHTGRPGQTGRPGRLGQPGHIAPPTPKPVPSSADAILYGEIDLGIDEDENTKPNEDLPGPREVT